jgi:hypothetical protein
MVEHGCDAMQPIGHPQSVIAPRAIGGMTEGWTSW